MPEVLNGSGGGGIKRPYDPPLESLRNHISTKDMGTRLVRDGPQLSKKHLKSSKMSPEEELNSYVFSFYSDMPEEIISSAARSLVSIMHSDLPEEQRKTEVEELLDQSLNGSQFESLRSIVQRIALEDHENVDMSGNTYQNDGAGQSGEEEGESDAQVSESDDETPVFVTLNDPVRVRDKTLVRPQEVDSYWLESKVSGLGFTVEEIIKVLQNIESFQYSERIEVLKTKLGLENFGLAQILAKNTSVVLWYTLLARATTGVSREQILEGISERGLNLEQVASDYMDQDLPKEVDLGVIGRPVSVPVYLNLKLPDGSTRFMTHDYEQYNVPKNKPILKVDWKLKSIDELPEYAQPRFTGLKTLNAVQSKVSDVAINTDINVLLCAPTGAGKSNVALLALTRCLHVHGDRVVYISPLKALVQEQVKVLQEKLPDMIVAELSGDQSINREQLQTVDVIISTPEKWDIVSRKPANIELIRSIGLVIIDEIHLLHDERRGTVIENIVARHKQQASPPRLLGLSATLPNYEDVAQFLNVPSSGLFYFDASFRPVPLEQQFVGVTSQGPLKQVRAIEDVCAIKVTETVVEGKKQALIFVHSRRDTSVTRNNLVENTSLDLNQIGIHHAGLSRDERNESETKFREGQYRVLVCTATLAWGVNLPAATVIIKGTQYYDPSADGWKQLGPQDVMQMLGRAGRPGFDSEGLGIIITTQKYLGYFASVASLSLPIQSHLVSHITDSLNAEIALYNIKNVDEAATWIQNTFWAVRFKSDPEMYGENYNIIDVAHSALLSLNRSGACLYEYPNVSPKFQGIIAAEFYISPNSVALYAKQLKPWLSEIDIIRVFARSAEFSSLSIRRGEVAEIRRLSQLVPYPIRDEVDSKYAKVAILLQAYISRLPLTGLALSSDMAYVAQSASRLFRAFFEISLALKWSKLALLAHNLYLMVDKRLWIAGQSYFRQYEDCPLELAQRVESLQLPWQRYFDLEENDIGDVLRLQDPKIAAQAYRYLSIHPRFNLSSEFRPISTDWALLTTEIDPIFEFDAKYHHNQDRYWLLVESMSGELLFHRSFSLKELLLPKQQGGSEDDTFRTTLRVPISPSATTQKYSPYIFVRLLSDRWLGSDAFTTVNLRSFEPPSHITAASLISEEAFGEEKPETLTNTDESFTVATALKPILENTERSAYIGIPPCKALETCISTVIDHAVKNNQQILVLTFNKHNKEAGMPPYLENDLVRYIEVEAGERLSRQPTNLMNEFKDVECIICEDLHRIGSLEGHKYELLVTRLQNLLKNVKRIVGFGFPVSSARSLAQWLGASKSDVVNFGFDVIQNPPGMLLLPWRGIFTLLSSFRSIHHLVAAGSDTLLLITPSLIQSRAILQECNQLGIEDSAIISSPNATHNKRVLITSLGTTKSKVRLQADVVILFGTLDMAPSDMLSIVGLAKKQVIIFSDQLEFDESCVNDPIPLESNLAPVLAQAMIPEIVNGQIRNPQDAVDWLAKSFLYRRLRANTAYYGSKDLQDWVSEAIESAFESLAAVGAVSMDEETLEIEPLALSYIISREGVDLDSVVTSDSFAHETVLYSKEDSYEDTEEKKRVLNARIDYAVATNRLSMLFTAVDLRQALLRHLRAGMSPLLQLPHVDAEFVFRCNGAGIFSIQDFIAIEDDDLRSQLLGIDNEDERMLSIAEFVNHFPIVDITSATIDNNNKATIQIERDIELDDEITEDGWYLVIGDNNTDEIWGFKHLEPISSRELSIEMNIDGGDRAQGKLATATVWLICGSYIDADKEITISGTKN